MTTLKKKNDYSVIVFMHEEKKPKKWTFVHNLQKFSHFLDKNHPQWHYMNVYNRRSSAFMFRFQRGATITAFRKQ